MKIKFHGTNKKRALKIMKEGFRAGTHFACHLEDSLEFGGSWVFMVEFPNGVPDSWQFVPKRKIGTKRIKRLTQYRPIVRVGTQIHLTRKVDSKNESRNLIGIPLKNN